MPVADHEPRRALLPAPSRLDAGDAWQLADAHHRVRDLDPSPERHPQPIRAVEHRDDFTVGVAEADADLDLRAVRDTRSNIAGCVWATGVRAPAARQVYAQTFGYLPKSPGEIAPNSALVARGSPAKRHFAVARGSER
jgi:hypothetical protein